MSRFYCTPIAYHLGLNAYLGSPHPTRPIIGKKVLMTVRVLVVPSSGDLASEHAQYVLLVGCHIGKIVLFIKDIFCFSTVKYSVFLIKLHVVLYIYMYNECFSTFLCAEQHY